MKKDGRRSKNAVRRNSTEEVRLLLGDAAKFKKRQETTVKLKGTDKMLSGMDKHEGQFAKRLRLLKKQANNHR